MKTLFRMFIYPDCPIPDVSSSILLVFLYLGILSPVESFSAPSEPILIGRFKSVTEIPHGIRINASNANIQILAYTNEIIRIRILQDEFRNDFSYAVIKKPEGTFSGILDQQDHLILNTGSIRLIIQKNPIRFRFLTRDGQVVNEDYDGFGVTWSGTEVTCHKKLFPDEKFLGLGEKTGNLDRRGSSYENWNTDIPGYSAREDPLYVTIPFFIGIHDHLTYGIFLDNSYRTKFNFGASTDNMFSSFSAVNGEMNYYFFGSSGIREILQDYTWLTGRMELPPMWSLGYQQCRWGYYPESEVMSVAGTFRDKNIPCDVLYLDIDYMEGYKIFTWNNNRFPQPKQMIDQLRDMGFHVVTIVDPGIKVETGYSMYEEGIEHDYFIKYPDGRLYIGEVWPGRCHFPDFTNPETRIWWGNSFTTLVTPGVQGFWNDMNEPSAWGQCIPDIVGFDFDGHPTTMAQAHNVYGLEMSRSTYEGTKQLMNGERPFLLTRAAYAGIQRYSAVWTGDNLATDEHMMLAVRMVNSMGLSGLAFVGPDQGGFMGEPTKELYIRWLSLGVYTPFFRSHSAVNTKDQEPWSFGEDAEAISIDLLSHRYRLLPYLYAAFYVASQTGIPVARSLAIDYTFDEKVYWWDYQHEYLFGDQILVCPVSSTQEFAKVYLPHGKWYRFGNDEMIPGNSEILVEAPLHDLPVFIRSSGIIPLQSAIRYTSEPPDPTLEIHVYQGNHANSFTMYEDDGITYGYEKGVFFKRIITFDPSGREIVFSKAEGSFQSKFTGYKLIFHGFEPPVEEALLENSTDRISVHF